MRSAAFGFFLSLLALIGLVCVLLFAPDQSVVAIAILSPLIAVGTGVAARAEPPSKRRLPPILCVLLVLSVLGACTATYTGQHARVALTPRGTAGLTVVISVGAQEVCRVDGERATLAVHQDQT